MEKVLLITGASSDVGMALAGSIAANYDAVMLHYSHMNSKLEVLAEELKAKTEVVLLEADFAREEEVDALIAKIRETGRTPNNIVHLPGVPAYNKQFHKEKWENFQLSIDVSLRSAVKILQDFMPAMAKEKYGRVVFMLTSYTQGIPPKFQSCYVTYKYALLGLMKALSAEYAAKGITVNGVSPEMMETKFLADIPELIVQQNAASSPLGRNVKIEEVIPVMEYMLSDAGAAITGQNIAISGGL